MKLLLKVDLPGCGEAGEVVEIADGFGRNYLLPQRLAVPNTPENRLWIESEKLQRIQREADRKERAAALSKHLKNVCVRYGCSDLDVGVVFFDRLQFTNLRGEDRRFQQTLLLCHPQTYISPTG